jgi:N6-adenosine-specific RNA methylase IME4
VVAYSEGGVSLFAPLPTPPPGGFACIACDAGLHFKTWSSKGQGRAPSQHYRDHGPEALLGLPLKDVLAPDAWLWLWWPDIHAPHISETMGAFGFTFSGRGFTWFKTRKSLACESDLILETSDHFGLGKTTRKNSESCWLGRRGKPKILSHSVREVIVSPVREHSRKPDEFYCRVEQFCPGPRIDLFGRESRPGWTVYGAEATKFDPPLARGAAS